jgi:hypothetical protein
MNKHTREIVDKEEVWRRHSDNLCERGSDGDHSSADPQNIIFDLVILSIVDVLVQGSEKFEDTMMLDKNAE